MSDKIYIHLAASTNTDLKFTRGRTGNPNPAPLWETVPAADASPVAAPASVKEIEKYPPNGRKMESIQIVLRNSTVGQPTNAVVNLFAVRGGRPFRANMPNAGAQTQRLIAKLVVTNGMIDFKKSVFKESLTIRKNRGGAVKRQQNHRPGNGDSRGFRVVRINSSAAMSTPGPVPIGTPPGTLKPAPGVLLVHGGLHLAFSPNA